MNPQATVEIEAAALETIVSDDRLAEIKDSYSWLSRHPTYSGRNVRASMDAEHVSLLSELQHCRARYCPACRGLGYVPNPDVTWYRAEDGAEGCSGPEEIDCPECWGVGFKKPRPPAVAYQPVERDDGMPF